MNDSNALTTLSDAQYLQTPKRKAHGDEMLASKNHPTGILGELLPQMADPFWQVRVNRTPKDQFLAKNMIRGLVYKYVDDYERKITWLALHKILSKIISNGSLTGDEETMLMEYLVVNGHNLNQL